jgi:1,4-dihydroxy-2-naphthoate octaprenyltransferase
VFTGLSELRPGTLTRVLRHTIVAALIVGLAGIVLAVVFNQLLAALGIVIGLAMALVNQRLLDAAIARADAGEGEDGEPDRKALRRAIGARSATRLVVITGVAIGLMFVNGPLGIGTVVGLVIFQIAFVFNVGRTLATSGVV